MSNNLKAKQIEEATHRLEMLEKMGMHENVLADFKQSQLVNYSERHNVFGVYLMGALYWVTNDTAKSDSGKAFADVIKEFEDEHDAVVYHATHEHTKFGELLDLFYVSQYEEEWDMDRTSLDCKYPCVYVVNLDASECSEFGTIGFELNGGGIIRTA